MRNCIFLLLLQISFHIQAQNLPPAANGLISEVAGKVITWRRYLHEHPELSNREVNTAAYVTAHLRSLGLEVKTGIATNGVVGILKGGKPGSVMALRADMDALPVTERNDLPFKSTATS